jgi:hypothetical protein
MVEIARLLSFWVLM